MVIVNDDWDVFSLCFDYCFVNGFCLVDEFGQKFQDWIVMMCVFVVLVDQIVVIYDFVVKFGECLDEVCGVECVGFYIVFGLFCIFLYGCFDDDEFLLVYVVFLIFVKIYWESLVI